MRVARRALCALLVAGAAACQEARAPEALSVGTAAELAAELRALGAQVVESGETLQQPFFSVPGQVLEVNGERVMVFAYPDGELAAAEAAILPRDGTRFRDRIVDWVAPPHFFHRGALIVLYVGESADVLAALRSLLGVEVAGPAVGTVDDGGSGP